MRPLSGNERSGGLERNDMTYFLATDNDVETESSHSDFEIPKRSSRMSAPESVSTLSRRGSDVSFGMEDPISGRESPQLVMPSIMLPSRRPFTEKGKGMGRLKVLIAGDSGVGKSSLIRALVQCCEDIVHVDPITPKEKTNNSQIREIHASTKPYPSWWSEFDESPLRGKSMGDTVLERNICFVDTPGYGNGTSFMECITPVVQYVESQFDRATSTSNMGDGEMINFMSGNGGSQVDVVFYIIKHRMRSVDIEYIRRLTAYTNVIPLIGHVDTLKADLPIIKANILSELRSENIKPFLFDVAFEDAQKVCAPYAISTATTSDYENMDASLLMSSEYMQPLVPTELSVFVDKVFQPESISWLRHLAAKKFVQWRNNPTRSPYSQQLSPSPSFALARITDHTQREERLAQVRLSKWAADLQRSIQNERARFEAVAMGERAVWLTERLGDCVEDGTLVPTSRQKKGSYSRRIDHKSLDQTDPLGLLQFNEELKQKGWQALQIVGSVGVMGGLAFFISRSWRSENVWELDFSRMGLDW